MIGCQRNIAQQIVDAGGDYLLAIKDNHTIMHEELKFLFEEAIATGFDMPHRDGEHTAAFFARTIRDHWGVENRLHWSLDVTFHEDPCRLRQGHAAENFSRLCRLAMNLLKQEKTSHLSLPRKRLRAAWDAQYALKVLGPRN